MFIGNPFSKLINEIKPPILHVLGAPGEGVRPNIIYLHFVPVNEYSDHGKKASSH